MKSHLYILLILILPFGDLFAQTEPLSEIDFSAGDHKLICIQRGEIIGENLLNEWVSKDITLLNELKDRLVFRSDQEEDFNSENSTTYQLILLQNDSVVSHFFAYPNTNQVLFNNRYFFSFDFNWFFNANYELEPITLRVENFQSAEFARQKHEFLSKCDSVVFIYPPDWIDYNGFFYFLFYPPEGDSNSLNSYSDTIREYIIDRCKTERFDLTFSRNDGKVCGVNVKANKELFNKLKQDKITWGAKFFEDSIYNCSFDFIYRTQNVGLTFPDTKTLGESLLETVKYEIDAHYPNSTYELYYSGFGGGATEENPLYYRYTINCDEGLFKSFELFESFCSWNEYELELKYYCFK